MLILSLKFLFVIPVLAPPSPPLITAMTSTTTSTLRWTQLPADAVQNYTLSWAYQGPCSDPGIPPSNSQILDASSRTFILTNLISSSVYLVRLQATNDAGAMTSQIIVNTLYEGM